MCKEIAKDKLRLNSRRSYTHVAYVRLDSGSIRRTEPVGRLQSPAGLGVESASSTRLTINTSCESDSDDNNGDDRCTRADARFLVLYPIRVIPRSLVSSPLDTRATAPSPLPDQLAHLFSRTRTLCPPLHPLHTLCCTLGPSHARSHHRKWRLERTSACPRERRASRKRSSTPSPARVRRRLWAQGEGSAHETDWYDIKAPSFFENRNVGKTLVNRSQGLRMSFEQRPL